MTLKQNKIEMHWKYVVADLGRSGIGHHKVFQDCYYGTCWPVGARASDLPQVPKSTQRFPSIQFCIVTRISLADLFISLRRELLLPRTSELQGQWLTWVVEVQGTSHQLEASDHIRNWRGKRYRFGSSKMDQDNKLPSLFF